MYKIIQGSVFSNTCLAEKPTLDEAVQLAESLAKYYNNGLRSWWNYQKISDIMWVDENDPEYFFKVEEQ